MTLVIPAGVSATLALVRHGESTYVAEGRFQGRQDPPLSNLGARQAALVAARLAARDDGTPLPLPSATPTTICHSPLRRAADTAAAIAAAQSDAVVLRPVDGLIEIAQGEWEGRLAIDVRANWPAELAAWRSDPAKHHAPGGESLPDASARVAISLAAILDSLHTTRDAGREIDPVPGYPGASAPALVERPWAILVAHDGIFRLTLLALLGLPLTRFWSVPFNLCAITVVGLHGGAATLHAHNLSEHLAPLAHESRAAEEARGERPGAL